MARQEGVVESAHILRTETNQHVDMSSSITVITPETATDQSIVSRTRQSQRQQQSFQPSLHRPEVGGERRRDAKLQTLCPYAP